MSTSQQPTPKQGKREINFQSAYQVLLKAYLRNHPNLLVTNMRSEKRYEQKNLQTRKQNKKSA